MLRLEKLLELLGRSRDYGASAANYYRPLHQVRMLQQEADHRLLGGVVRGLQLQFVETLVLADQICNWAVEHPDYLFERLATRRRFEIFDSVELDTAGV